MEEIRIGGARQHNLKNVSLTLPRNKLVVFTGVSGSGKSSLAFDTLYAEGQRRYVESLSTYARQYLEQMEKPDVDFIEGLSPAIAIEQRTAGGNPRSTIATTTEIHDFLRLLFAHLGRPHHPKTGKPLRRWSVQQMVDRVLAAKEGTPIQILAPVILKQKGEFRDVVEKLRREGFVRARMDGAICELEQPPRLDKSRAHTIEAVIDRLKIGVSIKTRLTDSLELALKTGNGVVTILFGPPDAVADELTLSNQNFDPETGYRYAEITPRHFSFNSPQGACPVCDGLGTESVFDPALLIPDGSVPLEEMPVVPWRRASPALAKLYRGQLSALAAAYNEPMSRPWRECGDVFQRALIEGTGAEKISFTTTRNGKTVVTERPFEGLIAQLTRLHAESKSELTRHRLHQYMTRITCRTCGGARLRPEVLAVTLGGPPSQGGDASPPPSAKFDGREETRVPTYGLNIAQFSHLSITAAQRWLEAWTLTPQEEKIGGEVRREILQRLGFLNHVGLGYLTLDRESGTLSGGEAQRIRLATQIGSKLTGVLYILDEPSIGLHQRDNERLLETLRELRDLGNTVIVVEHDEDTIRAADYLVDLGPHAGLRGGQIVAAGTVEEVLANPKSLTGRFLNGAQSIRVPKTRLPPNNGWVRVINARENNLRNVTVGFPVGRMTCVTGVSGSGKSTLVNDVLCRALFRHFYQSKEAPGAHDGIDGIDLIDKAVVIDQTPIGRTPRSNPLTYTGAFNSIRDLFAQLPSSRVRGYGPGRFSFNVKGGRCEHCEGDGVRKIEMNFLPPVYVTCEACGGRRFNRETLEITYKGLNIADVLEMTVDDGLNFFRNVPAAADKLDALTAVGLGYLHLGQQATTLSGGEAQRVKLAAELAKRATGRTMYIMDEPTSGLHFADIEQLLQVLFKLRNAGNTLVVIEHQLDVIKCADYVIDLGPEGGEGGGQIVAKGTPEFVAAQAASHTGRFLRKVLGGTSAGSALQAGKNEL
ncbi:MAG TPA: excinuclease ABC subunit UvrA [Candidatus Methylacidiphilales bacterium]|nr:excinuclease ABC subunit UvrA [Candidatus Methylacidiphilales bacterium]